MSAFIAFILRSFVEGLEDWKRVVQRLLFQPLVYLLVFGKLLGQALPGSDYTRVVSPGVLSMLVMNAAVNTVGGVLVRGYYFRTMEGWLLVPISLGQLMLAFALGGTLAGFTAGIVGVALAYVVLGLIPVSLLGVLGCLLCGALAFSLLGIVGYTLPRTPVNAQEVLAFLLLPMMFFGCTFYSYAMLAPPWNTLALFFPTTYLSEALRAAYGVGAIELETGDIVWGGTLALVALAAVARRAFARRLREYLW